MQEPLNVLLVEDDEVDVMNVQRAFKQRKIAFPLSIATNGIEALAMLQSHSNIDSSTSMRTHKRRLILLDLNMPRMNGFEFLKTLRQDPNLQSTPVVVLTTSDDANDRQRAYEFNVAGYLLKSVTFQQFAESMEALTRYWSLCKMP